jgi:hypothetical protein
LLPNAQKAFIASDHFGRWHFQTKEKPMNRSTFLLAVMTVMSCGASTMDALDESDTSETQDALGRGQAILQCTGENGGTSVAMTIFEHRDTHVAQVEVSRGGKTASYSQRVFGDLANLGVNRHHVSFLNRSVGFSLEESFRKKIDINSFRPAFVYRKASVDMGNAGLTCTRMAKTKYLYPQIFP